MPDDPPKFRLDAFLKYAGWVATGGEAKVRIQSGDVQVNGEVETRRRRQLEDHDRVAIDDEEAIVSEMRESSGASPEDDG